MRLLSLDLSTKTGWAVFDFEPRNTTDYRLVTSGAFRDMGVPEDHGSYPFNYLVHSSLMADQILQLVSEYEPTDVLIEETTPSRENYSQRQLEFLHYEVLKRLCRMFNCSKVRYVRTGVWRKAVNLRLSKEQAKGNLASSLRKNKQKAANLRSKIKALGGKLSNKDNIQLLKTELGRLQLGKVTRKHLAVAMANQLYGLDLQLQDNDQADAILIGTSFFKGVVFCDGYRPTKKKTPVEA